MYQVIGVAKHSETLEDYVVYKPLYRGSIAKLWIRPMAMFKETVEVNGKKTERFQYIK